MDSGILTEYFPLAVIQKVQSLFLAEAQLVFIKAVQYVYNGYSFAAFVTKLVDSTGSFLIGKSDMVPSSAHICHTLHSGLYFPVAMWQSLISNK